MSRVKQPRKEINPYVNLLHTDLIREQIFAYLIVKLREFAISCQNPNLKTSSHKEIIEASRVLKQYLSEINFFLKELIPREAKHNREAQLLRVFRQMPDFIVWIIDEYYKPKLRTYLLPSYKGQTKRTKEDDVKKFCEAEFKWAYRKTIDIRSEATIIVCCVAAQYGVSGYKLTNLYYNARKMLKRSNKVN
jgi:hypothetical protein